MKMYRWHVYIDTSKAALERCMRALLLLDAGLVSGKYSRMLPRRRQWGRGVTAAVVIDIPEGSERRFVQMARPVHMVPPPGPISVGTRPRPERDDADHPGLAPEWDASCREQIVEVSS